MDRRFQSGHRTAGYVDRGFQSGHRTASYVDRGGGTSEIVGIKILIKQNDQIFEAFLPNLEHSLSKELLEVLFRYVQKTKGNDLAQLQLCSTSYVCLAVVEEWIIIVVPYLNLMRAGR